MAYNVTRHALMHRKSVLPSSAPGWQTPVIMLLVMAAAMQLSFAVWWTLIKNFAVEDIGMTGRESVFKNRSARFRAFWPFS